MDLKTEIIRIVKENSYKVEYKDTNGYEMAEIELSDVADEIVKLIIPVVINWVACKDELPKKDGDYLVCEDGFVFDAGYSVKHNDFHDYEVTQYKDVTHWSELPKPPCL